MEKVQQGENLKFVVIRTDSAGVHFGYLKSCVPMNGFYAVELVNTRRIWSWSGANDLSDLAINGVTKPQDCKFSGVLPENWLMAIEVIHATEAGKASLEGVAEWNYKDGNN